MLTCIFENNNKDSLRHVVADSLVLDSNKILLVKRASHLLEGGKWGIVGGFVQRDQTIEEAAKREIFEETGYSIKNLTLLRVIDTPNRRNEDRQNIAFVFFCEAVNKTGIADNESTEQTWFDLDNLPKEEDFAFDYYDSIKFYKKFFAGKVTLPRLS